MMRMPLLQRGQFGIGEGRDILHRGSALRVRETKASWETSRGRPERHGTILSKSDWISYQNLCTGTYLWISYFWSYLNEQGRAGFVMSSQASSAGHGEKEVRKKIVQTGDVDVMISIRSNFFYSRTVPCELWFFDRAKPAERQDKVLMLDARQVYRQVTRKIYDFSPEHMKNLSAIVWLYRGQQSRFLALVKDYLGAVCVEGVAISAQLAAFEKTLADLRDRFSGLVKGADQDDTLDEDKKKALMEAATELADAEKPFETDRTALLVDLDSFRMQYTMVTALPRGEEQ